MKRILIIGYVLIIIGGVMLGLSIGEMAAGLLLAYYPIYNNKRKQISN